MITYKNQKQLTLEGFRAAPFRCLKKVTLLNVMHYCLDRGSTVGSDLTPPFPLKTTHMIRQATVVETEP